MQEIKRADWVTCRGSSVVGTVTRLARDSSWADVKWAGGGRVKRMRTSVLVPHATIQAGDWTITDVTRARELQEDGAHDA